MKYKTASAIITSVDIESEYVMRLYDWKRISAPDDHKYFSASFERDGIIHRIITAEQNNMGMTAAVFLASRIIHLFSPKYLIMCGIAAGLGQSSDQLYGDVMIPDVVWDYSAGKFVPPEMADISFGKIGFIPRPLAIRTDESVLKIIRGLQGKTEFKLHIGPMACGSAVIANREAINKRISAVMPDTVGVDMESYGIYYAAENSLPPRPKAIVIKSICDYADSAKSDQYQKFAAYTSSEFTKYLLEKHLPLLSYPTL
ncbi:MAG: hypothetical protein IJG55_00595 [Synergistaceae bacterium]|nr:hypothetical protein [Synergistaceae bacterium]